MLFVILSGKGCFSGGRDIVIRQFFAIDFLHVFGGDIDSRLYLEDVLVAVVFTCRIRSTRCAPLCVCATVEVRAERIGIWRERIGIWRVRIDFPVAVFARLDGILLCRRQILERTILALYVDDNSIVVLRIGLQRTVVILTIQFDNTILTRRGQVDILMSRDTIDMDVARSLDIDAVIDGGNAVAYSDVCSMNRNTFIRTDLASVRSASSRFSATNGHVTSRIDCEVFQAH